MSVKIVSGGLIALHALRLLLSPRLQDTVFLNGALIPQRFWGVIEGAALTGPLGATFTLFSHALLHADWAHVLVNAIMLLAMGKSVHAALDLRGGRANERFLLLFFVSVLAGALAHLATAYPGGPAAIGASGGVSGLLAAALLIMQQRQNFGQIRLLTPQFMMVSIAFLIANAILAFIGPQMLGGGIAWQAHIGGYIGGALLFRGFMRDRSGQGLT